MSGIVYGVGVGPGDPELLTLKAHRIISTVPVVAYPAPENGESFARSIVSPFLKPEQTEIVIAIPMRADRFPAQEIYDRAAASIGGHIEQGRDVAILCEGDPFFYGSFMYLFERLAGEHRIEIIPGVSSIMAGAARMKRPLAGRNEVLSIIPAPLPDHEIRRRLDACEAAAIIKVGRHFPRIRRLLQSMDLDGATLYGERLTLPNESLVRLRAKRDDSAPYFSLLLVHRSGTPIPEGVRKTGETVS